MIFIFFIKILSKLPLFLLYVFADAFYPIAKRWYRRNLVINNIQKAFPDKPEKEVKQMADEFYKNFLNTIVEVIKALSISKKEITKRIKYKNTAIVEELRKQNKPILLYPFHYCNWEWLLLSMSINFDKSQFSFIYEELSNKKIDKLIYRMRSKFDAHPIKRDVVARQLIKMKNDHHMIALGADQTPPRNHGFWTHFMGLETNFSTALVNLPYLMQAHAVFVKMMKIKKGHYEIELLPMASPPYNKKDYRVLMGYIKEMEKIINKKPQYYLWSHNRWKHTRNKNEELIHQIK